MKRRAAGGAGALVAALFQSPFRVDRSAAKASRPKPEGGAHDINYLSALMLGGGVMPDDRRTR